MNTNIKNITNLPSWFIRRSRPHRFLQIMQNSRFMIIDTEFTCQEDSLRTNWQNNTQPRHLVQIAALTIEPITLKIINHQSLLIKPPIQLDPFFEQLTGITQSQVNKEGITLKNALNQIFPLQEPTLPIFFWGWDHNILGENLLYQSKTIPYLAEQLLTNSHDLREMFSYYGLDVHEINSGKLYQTFNLPKPQLPKHQLHNQHPNNLDEHDALFDCLSLHGSLKNFMSIIN